MKFLLEFVSCCGASRGNSSRTEVPETSGSRSEETRVLVRTISYRRCRRKRGRAGSGEAVVAEWKPTLRSISEDNVVVAEERGTERVVKRKGSAAVGGGGGKSGGGGGGSRDIASLYSYIDDYRRNHVTTVIPAFSPTPFMI